MTRTKLFVVALLLSLVALVLQKAREYSNIQHFPINSRILLLFAHPDDECMFFAPTILALTHPIGEGHKPNIYSLCLSVGDAHGLGRIRREELDRSLDVLGLDVDNRAVVEHPNLADNLTTSWDPAVVAQVVLKYVNEYRITTILTFDDRGVSGHPNHKSLPSGVKYLFQHYTQELSGTPPSLFVLITHGPMTKYTGILSVLNIWLAPRMAKAIVSRGVENAKMVIVADTSQYVTALIAMWQHWSQLVWFRWLYVLFSRYMWVNEWVEVPIFVL